MKYEVILFDADGTLFDYDKAEAFALANAFAELGMGYDEGKVLDKYRLINKQLWMDYERGKITSTNLRLKRFKMLFEADYPYIDAKVFSEVYLSFLAKGDFLLDGAEEVCRLLSTKYKLAIITNGIKEVQYGRFNTSPLEKYIQHVIVSEEAGFQKPDIGIFEYAFRKIGHVDKSNTLIVGDSLTSDIQGGFNYGITTCWYNPANAAIGSTVKPDYEIRHLKELLLLLEDNCN